MKGDSGKEIISILSKIYKDNSDDFGIAIQKIYGSENQYLSQNKFFQREPKMIPNSPYWLENNLSLPQRIIIVFKIMDTLGYDYNDIIDTLRNLTQHSQP